MEREIASFRSLLTAEECPLELSLATLGAQGQGSSSSAGEGTAVVERRGAATTGEGRPARTAHASSMSALYAELRALLPNLPSGRRATKDEILDAAVERVKALEDTAAVLEAYRGAPPRRRNEVAVVGPAVCLSARLPAPAPGALRRVLEAFDRRGVQVLAATLERHGGPGAAADAVVTVTAVAAPPEVLEMIRADIACIR